MGSPNSIERVLVRIEVHADTLCPWCYIQKKSLDAAIIAYQEKHPEVEFEVMWRPFYLYPLLERGADKASIYNKPSLEAKIKTAGQKHNIHFSPSGTTGPSRSSHLLISLALQQLGPAAQSRVLDLLFHGHFELGRDVADEDWLADEVAPAAGLDPRVVRRALGNDVAQIGVDEEVRGASVERGVTAVPCVTVQGRYRVGGYQESGVFEGLFDKIRMEE